MRICIVSNMYRKALSLFVAGAGLANNQNVEPRNTVIEDNRKIRIIHYPEGLVIKDQLLGILRDLAWNLEITF